MLERHIVLLKAAVQEMYAQLQHCHAWVGPVLSETIGHPSIHDILAALDLRQHANEGDHHGNVCKPGVAALHISIGGGAGALKHSQGSEPASVKPSFRVNARPAKVSRLATPKFLQLLNVLCKAAGESNSRMGE
ncbi:Fluconazole resistance protein 1 [Friedmanniomyces endolithicus]|uniref:Fluconazole resistance protein 1 n=1 Tax=Friedmanniomyces endolithicus TaxID=329885 RepID=A0AAN6F4X5_9PEZI|nr:Fluconazole resistance protein 1 [Friedmanniomyces endolithicus]KAK0302448.1 Fluconazole resistance protein 1 [Friedmanniomyces endolithicus]